MIKNIIKKVMNWFNKFYFMEIIKKLKNKLIMPTFRQLALKGRIKKRRRCIVAALKGAPHRRGVVVKMGITTPKKTKFS